MTKELNKKEKLALLQRIEEGEKRLFHNFSTELELLINDENEEIRSKAILHLWNYPTRHFLKNLIHIANTDVSPSVRTHAIISLGRYIYEYATNVFTMDFNVDIFSEDLEENDFKNLMQLLLSIFQNTKKSITERCAALEALSYYTNEDIINLINGAFHSENPDLKKSALKAMGHNRAERWKTLILNELYKQDSQLCIAAARAAGEYKLIEAGPLLLKLAQSNDKEIVKEAMLALSKIKFKEAYNTIEKLSNSENTEIQKLAMDVLEKWHSEHTICD
jgi:HEAT repeat protein